MKAHYIEPWVVLPYGRDAAFNFMEWLYEYGSPLGAFQLVRNIGSENEEDWHYKIFFERYDKHLIDNLIQYINGLN